MFQRICYGNKDALSAGIIVAGWDKEAGPSVYNIPLGGGLFRQPWSIGGGLIYLLSERLVLNGLSQALDQHMSMAIAMQHIGKVGDERRRSNSLKTV